MQHIVSHSVTVCIHHHVPGHIHKQFLLGSGKGGGRDSSAYTELLCGLCSHRLYFILP